MWYFDLSKGSEYFHHDTIIYSSAENKHDPNDNFAPPLLDLPIMSLCLAAFFLCICLLKFFSIIKRWYIENFITTGLMCTLSNWLAGGGMVPGGGMFRKKEVALPRKSSDDSWSLLFEKALSYSICSGNANAVGTLNHICEWYTLKYKNTGNKTRKIMHIFYLILISNLNLNQVSGYVCNLYLHGKLPCWSGSPNELWLYSTL